MGESPHSVTLEKELKAGQFGAIRSLLRVLEGGAASKVSQSPSGIISQPTGFRDQRVANI